MSRIAIAIGAANLALALPAGAADLRFREVAAELGVRFEHRHYGTGEKYMPENMGAGVAVLDYNGDDRLDLFFVQGAPIAPGADVTVESDRLFRQRPDGRFEDATATAGIVEHAPGMGVAFGDVDRDGDIDLYVTNFGPNALWRNRGDGTFEDATAEAGVATETLPSGAPSWSSAAGFFDADGDSDHDLYVARYLDFRVDRNKFCGNAQARIRAYCHPDVYDGAPQLLPQRRPWAFHRRQPRGGAGRNPQRQGPGRALRRSRPQRRAGHLRRQRFDPNYLYLNDWQRRGHFREQALLTGVAVDGTGAPEASMGIELGDLDGDGMPEIFLTHLDEETNTLYRSYYVAEEDPKGIPSPLWTDATEAFGLGAPSLPWVGFGTVFFDPDDDGDLDVFVANGHIIDNIDRFAPGRTHRQPAQLFVNPGKPPLLEAAPAVLGLEPLVGRGAVAADLDDDGDEDLVVTQNGGRALVLRNETTGRGNSLVVRLRGTSANTQGFGATLSLRVGDRTIVRWLKSSTSYLSQGPPEVHFGLGAAKAADGLVVRWPWGVEDYALSLAAGRAHVVTEGSNPHVITVTSD